jgi:hypothetical protein
VSYAASLLVGMVMMAVGHDGGHHEDHLIDKIRAGFSLLAGGIAKKSGVLSN